MQSYFMLLPFWAKWCFILVFMIWMVYTFLGNIKHVPSFSHASRALMLWGLTVVWFPPEKLVDDLLIAAGFLSFIPIVLFPLVWLFVLKISKQK